MEDVLSYMIEAVRRNIRPKPLRWTLVLTLGVLWVLFAALTVYATFGALSRAIVGAS